MALVPCPECKREVSSAASACPHCGFPNPAPGAPSGPACYACSAPATTRCVKCGALSCATHLNNIFVRDGDSGANELRCRTCFDSAVASNWWGVVGGIAVFAVFLFVFVIVSRR